MASNTRPRMLRRLSALALGAALAGCGAVSTTSTTPQSTPAAPGSAPTTAPANPGGGAPGVACLGTQGAVSGPVIYGAGQNLWSMQPDGKQVTQITNVGARASLRDPAWSADRATLAYTLALPSDDPATMWLQTGMICGIDAKTGTAKVLASSSGPTDILVEPTWAPDGKSIVVTKRSTIMDDRKQFMGEQVSLVRYNLADNSEQLILKDGTSPALSPDGKQIVFVFVDPATYLTSLMIAGSDGANPKQLVNVEPGFLQVTNPRWTPDGKQVVFGALGGPTGGGEPARSASLLDRLLGVTAASAHGDPMTIWQVDTDGKNLKSLATGVDDPRVTWSPDGATMLYTNGLEGIVSMPSSGGATTVLTPPDQFWALAWSQH
ncbi:MAG TPA: hypothetical protein VGE07_02325 [Herpetosiphonaceae bacterium]